MNKSKNRSTKYTVILDNKIKKDIKEQIMEV